MRRCGGVLSGSARCVVAAILLGFVVATVLIGGVYVLDVVVDSRDFPPMPPEFLKAPHKVSAVFCTDGNGHPCPYPHPYLRDRPSVEFYRLIADEVQRLNAPAIFHMHLDDGDLFTVACQRLDVYVIPGLEQRIPNLFWLSWNPTSNKSNGHVFSKTIPIPDFETYNGLPQKLLQSQTLPYHARTKGLVAWRGSTTGCSETVGMPAWDRYHMVKAFLKYTPPALLATGEVSVAFSEVVQGDYHNSTVITSDMVGTALPQSELMKYKAVIDVDGNANAWSSLQWKLASGLCVLKVKSTLNYVQWYYHMLEHGVHLWLLDPSDPETMVREAIRVASNATLCSELGKNSAAFARRYFTSKANRAWLRNAIQSSVHGDTLRNVDWRIRGERRGRQG